MAMQLVEILPPAPLPLDEVRERVAEDWRAAELSKALAALAATHKDAVDGGASLSSLGIVSVKVGAGRDARLEAPGSGTGHRSPRHSALLGGHTPVFLVAASDHHRQ